LLNGTVEYYNNTTHELFLDRQLSRTSGAQSITNNLGKLRNSGFEVAITANIIRNTHFTWSIDANYSHNKNEMLDQNGLEKNITGLFINQVGQPINSLYLVRYAGVDPDNGDALYYEIDGKTTTNIYDPEHRVILGTTDPPHYGGFGTTVNYKGLQLEVLFSYAFGNVIYNNDRTNVENPIYWFSNLAKRMLNEWQQAGDVTDIPSSFNNWVGETSRYVEKADYLRLRNVMLSYSLPRSLTEKLKMRSLRVFAQGQNLHVWHNFLGYDPEVTTGNLLGSHYPQLRTVTFGLNVGF
jgi:TonB-dependent starch-binding outer membrane protein SusC